MNINLFRTEECVKAVERYGETLDENNRKFDHCYDCYEVLEEKTRIRFSKMDD
jgi:hypothetical protein